MKPNFLLRLGLTAVVCLLLAVGFQEWIMVNNHLYFLIATIGIFVVYSIVTHMFAIRAAKSDNKYAFSRISLGLSFIKLFLVIAIVVVYRLQFSTESIDFVWPFILIYIIFTVFEVGAMLKIAKL